MQKFFIVLLDFLFPHRCVGCNLAGEVWCVSCRKNTRTSFSEIAPGVYAVCAYVAPGVKGALWQLKYRGKKEVAEYCAEMLWSAALPELSDLAIFKGFVTPLLVPIPLSEKSARVRGFNQSALIAKALARIAPPHTWSVAPDVLVKIKETKRQVAIKKRAERLKNLTGSFAVKNPHDVRGKNILLIDDVTTTGATFAEARRALESAGARKVIALAFAH